MPEELEFSTKAMPGQLSVDEAEGIVEAFVAGIGNKDSVGDIVLPGAFSASLKRRKPRVVWGHNWNEPIGKVLDIYEVGPDDPRLPAKMKAARIGGLFARVQFNLKSERGREAFANIAFFGMEQEWSIGYKTITAAYDNSRQANLLREVELYEVSPVLHGANQLTGTISIKSDNGTDRISSFKKSKWPMFDRSYAEMIKEEHPKIWDAGGNIKGDDQYTILTKIAEQGGVAKTEDQIRALELREAWVARHEGDFLLPGVIAQIKWLAIGSRGEGHMKDVVREAIKKSNDGEKAAPSCPVATQDIAVNIKNRQNAIDTAAYGPLNPKEPNDKYWQARADRWDVSADDAKKQRCGNCAVFLKTPRILDCIKQGLGNETGNEAMDVIAAGDLGYCEAFDFKCASLRTCDAWVVGGPITVEKGTSEKNDSYWSESSDEDAMEELGRIAERMRVQDSEPGDVDEDQRNDAMGRRAVLARALANELRTPVRIRTMSENTVVFDIMDESEEPTTMRASWHAEDGRVMIGRPEKVRVETVYVPETGDSDGDAYMGDESMKAATDRVPTGSNLIPDAVPQERFTGDVLRGRGPRRGNLERLLRYWRPIMRREGGFRRCLVILADHPELYPLQNICAWLHHETTGLWPNEGCHHPGMKNCRRKLRGIVRGSLISDSDFNRRMNELKPDTTPNGKGMPDPFEWDSEKGDMGEVTEEDIQHAYKVMNWFAGEEKDFMKFLIDDENWTHEGDDEDGQTFEHEWVKPTNAPVGVSGKPGGCGCGCSGKGGPGSCMSDEKSVEDSLLELQEKVGRALNSRNADKISQAIRLLSEVVGEEVAGVAMQRKGDLVTIEAPVEDLFELRETIDPIIEHYALEAEVDESGIYVKGLVTDGVEMALKTAVSNFEDIQTKGLGDDLGKGLTLVDRFVDALLAKSDFSETALKGRIGPSGRPHDGDGDGMYSPTPGAPDKTPLPPIHALPDKDLLDLLKVEPQKPTPGRIGFNPGPARKLQDRKEKAFIELYKRGYSKESLAKNTDSVTAARAGITISTERLVSGSKKPLDGEGKPNRVTLPGESIRETPRGYGYEMPESVRKLRQGQAGRAVARAEQGKPSSAVAARRAEKPLDEKYTEPIPYPKSQNDMKKYADEVEERIKAIKRTKASRDEKDSAIADLLDDYNDVIGDSRTDLESQDYLERRLADFPSHEYGDGEVLNPPEVAKPSADKPKSSKDPVEDFKTRLEKVQSEKQWTRHDSTMKLLDDIADAQDDSTLDDEARKNLLALEIDILDKFDAPDTSPEGTKEHWKRAHSAMLRADSNTTSTDDSYKKMLRIYEELESVIKSEYSKREQDQIFDLGD